MSELQDIHQMPIRQSTRMWFGISLRTFGGPAGQIAVIHKVVVEEKKLISEEQIDKLKVMTDECKNRIAAMMNYFNNCEIKGLKFK